MTHRTGCMLLACGLALGTWGCRQTDHDRWNAFWGLEDPGGTGGLRFGRGAGKTETWLIECNAYRGPKRREMADRMAAALRRVRELRADRVRVEHEEDASRVLYGNYKLRYAQAKVDGDANATGDTVIQLSDEIKRDLRFVKTLALGNQHPFFGARPIPEPIEDVGPPEWDLRNAKGVYTLHVGVTYPDPPLQNYKQAAVEWVKALRDDGQEAYYYHHPDQPRSDVCIGTFGEDALIESADGKTRYSRAVEALRRAGDFRYNLENGRRVFRRVRNSETGKIERIANWSFLVKIPGREAGDLAW